MSTARDRILASIRDGLLRAQLPADVEPRERRSLPFAPAMSPAAMVEQFTAALAALTGHVHRAAAASDVAGIVARIAGGNGAVSYLSWDDEHLGCPALVADLASRGLARVEYDVPDQPGARAHELEELAAVGLGLTGAHAGIAENGALVLVSGPGRGRLVSLLPPVHVAILREDRVRPSLAAVIREEPGLLGAGSNVVMIAGPSRTADIEMTLTHGVHGPKAVHVILVP